MWTYSCTYISASSNHPSSRDRRPLADTKPHILVVADAALDDIPPGHLLVRDLGPVRPEELQRRLVQLHVGDLPAQAHARAVPERHVVLEEVPGPLRVLEPPLRAEVPGVVAVQVLVAVHQPRVARELRALGRELPLAEAHAPRPRDPREDVGRRGRQAHRLAQAGQVVGAVGHDVLVLRDAARGADPARLGGGVQLGHELGVDGRVREDVGHHGLERRAGRVCAREEHEEDLGLDVVQVQGLAVLVAGLDESGEVLGTRVVNVVLLSHSRLKQIKSHVGPSLDLLEPLVNELVSEAHKRSDSRILLGGGDKVFPKEGALDPVCHRVQPGHDTERRETIMEALDQALHVLALLDEAKRLAKANLGDDIVGHVDGPGGKVEPGARVAPDKELVEAVHPLGDAGVDEGLHLLDVGEAVGGGGDLAEARVRLGVLHVEERLGLAEAARDVVLGLVGLPAVDDGQLGRVAHQQHHRGDADDGALSRDVSVRTWSHDISSNTRSW